MVSAISDKPQVQLSNGSILKLMHRQTLARPNISSGIRPRSFSQSVEAELRAWRPTLDTRPYAVDPAYELVDLSTGPKVRKGVDLTLSLVGIRTAGIGRKPHVSGGRCEPPGWVVNGPSPRGVPTARQQPTDRRPARLHLTSWVTQRHSAHSRLRRRLRQDERAGLRYDRRRRQRCALVQATDGFERPCPRRRHLPLPKTPEGPILLAPTQNLRNVGLWSCLSLWRGLPRGPSTAGRAYPGFGSVCCNVPDSGRIKWVF